MTEFFKEVSQFLGEQIFANHHITILITLLIIAMICLVIALIKTRTNLRQSQYFLDVIRSVSKSISQNHEIAAFNENNEIIYTTHPQAYFDKESFFQVLIEKVTSSQNFQKFYRFFESKQPFSTLLSGSGSGLPNQLKKWHAFETFLDKSESLIGEDISIVTLTDISRQFSESEKISTNYERLENFLDYFPLGIFYVNNKGIIVGSNITFANLLNSSREKLIDINIKEFIKDFNFDIPVQKPCKISVKPKFSRDFDAFLIKSQIRGNSSLQPWIVLKTNAIENDPEKDNLSLDKNFFSGAVIPSVIVTSSGEIKSLNPAFATMVQDKVIVDKNKVFSKKTNLSEFIPSIPDNQNLLEYLNSNQDNNENPNSIEIKLADGNTVAVAYISKIPATNSEEKLFLIQLVDISSQKILEKQFIQSQKIQAVGQLAGGIAHDFNNLLTAMIGFCDLLLQRYTSTDPSYGDVMQIKQNAGRAANLVRQLLAFSRQQTLTPRVVSITELLIDLSSLLKRLIGVNVDLQIIHGRDLWPVKVDISQFEQVIINLIINARDAMNNNGEITIKTRNYYSEKDFKCIYDTAPLGDYVLLEVADTGCGIEPELIEKIFEPFFSRKDEQIRKQSGSGTGLGLSTVYGIINQTGGFINVDTKVGKGTTFKIYLPRYNGPETISKTTTDQISRDLSGSETILLVEDEDPVRMFASKALRDKGYKILEAASGEEALEIAQKEKFDLLITDVVMPKIDGPTLNKMLKDRIQNFKTIFISGYTEDTFRQDAGKNSQIHFLQKPFTLKDLATKVKEVLNAE